jgi:hypothetical protein
MRFGAFVLTAFGSQWLPETSNPEFSNAERNLTNGGTDVFRKLAISGRL